MVNRIFVKLAIIGYFFVVFGVAGAWDFEYELDRVDQQHQIMLASDVEQANCEEVGR